MINTYIQQLLGEYEDEKYGKLNYHFEIGSESPDFLSNLKNRLELETLFKKIMEHHFTKIRKREHDV